MEHKSLKGTWLAALAGLLVLNLGVAWALTPQEVVSDILAA